MRKITPLYDYFILATGGSRRQIHTITEEIDAYMHAHGEKRLAIEGYENSRWIVQDYGDIVVHVFDADSRGYYALEDFWSDAPQAGLETGIRTSGAGLAVARFADINASLRNGCFCWIRRYRRLGEQWGT